MNRKRIFRSSILILVAFFALSLMVGVGKANAQEGVSSPSEAQVQQSQTIYEIIQGQSNLSSLEALVEAAALNDNLQQDGPFTVFAPTDDALAAFNAASLDEGVSVTDILLYHVLNGEYMASDLAGKNSIMTLAGEYLYIDTADDDAKTGIVLNGTVMVITADIQASNGVVHIIDTVLPFPDENSDFMTDTTDEGDEGIQDFIESGLWEELFSVIDEVESYEPIQNTSSSNHAVLNTATETFANQR